MIICICRGKSEKDVKSVIEAGARTVRDLQRCGIGDQCGSCHNSLAMMLTQASVARNTPSVPAPPCPACAPAHASASL